MNQRLEAALEKLDPTNCDDCRRIAKQYQPGLSPTARRAFIENAEQHFRYQHSETIKADRETTLTKRNK